MNSKKKVLIVDDDADLRRLYAIGLTQHGYEVKLASNGAEAMDRVEGEGPDLILLDLAMPVMNGWEMLERLNPPERVPPIPIIVVTGDPEVSEQSHPNVLAWLPKPLSISELLAVVSALPNMPELVV